MGKIVVKTRDENWFVAKDEIEFTPDILSEDIIKFNDVREAKNFIRKYLSKNKIYDIVRVEIGYTEQLLDTINY